jgi:hypothetical protein
MLLTYMASEFWYPPPPSTATTTTSSNQEACPSWLLQKMIVLLEKAKNIDWGYIHESNEQANSQTINSNNNKTANGGFCIPRIEIWADTDTNLHNMKDVLTRFDTLCTNSDNDEAETVVVPQALCGIHLCKLLSPSLNSQVN